MEFTLSTAGYFYPNEDDRKKYEELGFKFEPSDYLKFRKLDINPSIDFNSLEELIAFANKFGDIIVSEGHIEIYDDYRE
jgi:hypothetical protein